jgi:hypothetical protein
VLPTTLLPWTAIAAAGVVAAIRSVRAGVSDRATLALLLGWSLGGLLLLTASSAKRTLYLLPILPAFCVLGGWWLDATTSKLGAGLMRLMAVGLGVFGAAAAITFAVQGWWPALVVVPISIWVGALCWRDRLARLPGRGAPVLLTATLLVSAVLAPAFVVDENEAADLEAAFARIRDEATRADHVLGVGLTERSRGLVCLALARDFDELPREEDLAGQGRLAGGRTLLICDGGTRPDLAPHLPPAARLESATDLETGPNRKLFLFVIAPESTAPEPATGG